MTPSQFGELYFLTKCEPLKSLRKFTAVVLHSLYLDGLLFGDSARGMSLSCIIPGVLASNGGLGLPDGLHLGSSKRSGLRIIQALVRQINGRLQLGRGPGNEGACFKFFFPATAAV